MKFIHLFHNSLTEKPSYLVTHSFHSASLDFLSLTHTLTHACWHTKHMSWAARDWVSWPLFTGAQACVLAFSTVDRDSFEAIETWKQKVGTGSHSWISMLHWPFSVQESGTDVGTCAGHEMHAVRCLWWGACNEAHVMRSMQWSAWDGMHVMRCMRWSACDELYALRCMWRGACCEVYVVECMWWDDYRVFYMTYTTMCSACDEMTIVCSTWHTLPCVLHVMRWLSCVLHDIHCHVFCMWWDDYRVFYMTYTTMCSACDYCVFYVCLPCVLHVTAVCSTCVVQVTAMFSTCTYHVFCMWLSCIIHAIMCSTCDYHVFCLWSSYVLRPGSSCILLMTVMCSTCDRHMFYYMDHQVFYMWLFNCSTGRAWSGRDCHGDCAEQDRSHWRCCGAAVSTSTSSVHSGCGAFVMMNLIIMVITVMIKFILKEL